MSLIVHVGIVRKLTRRRWKDEHQKHFDKQNGKNDSKKTTEEQKQRKSTQDQDRPQGRSRGRLAAIELKQLAGRLLVTGIS